MYTDFKLNHIYLTLKLSHSSFEWMTKSHVKKKCWDVERVKVKSVTVVPQDYRVWQTTHSYISSLWRSYTFFIYLKFQTLHMLYYSVIADPNLAEIKLPKNFLLCIYLRYRGRKFLRTSNLNKITDQSSPSWLGQGQGPHTHIYPCKRYS